MGSNAARHVPSAVGGRRPIWTRVFSANPTASPRPEPNLKFQSGPAQLEPY